MDKQVWSTIWKCKIPDTSSLECFSMHNSEKCNLDVELWQQPNSLCSSTYILKKLIWDSVGPLLINILSQPLTSHPDRQGILRPFTHRRRLWTADETEVFSPRMQIPCSKKTALLFFSNQHPFFPWTYCKTNASTNHQVFPQQQLAHVRQTERCRSGSTASW